MKPKLRPIEVHPVQHQGRSLIVLRDPLRLSDAVLALPRALGPLLGLMDGSRDEAGLEAALAIRAGVRLAPGLVCDLVAGLDSALLLDNDRSRTAQADALRDFRSAAHRPLNLDGAGPSGMGGRLGPQLQRYLDALPAGSVSPEREPVRGVISPHIDYARGGAVYAEAWRAAADAAREAEVVVVLGTDHNGSNGTVTLTRQSYATPWGVLPTDQAAVSRVAEAVGEDQAFAEELHHRGEHSIELAVVWLHFIRGGTSVPLVPILCGSFASFVGGEGEPRSHAPFEAMLDVLQDVIRSRRCLVVAAADLAHVGPAFGDPVDLDLMARARLRSADECLLAAVCAGDAEAFFGQLRAEGDRRHVCGLPPIYLALKLLGNVRGKLAGYAQCPADGEGRSFVSVAGVILR